VNYYCEELILKCIRSIEHSTEIKDSLEIIVVDNGSKGRLLRENQDNSFRLFTNDQNNGFGAACNFGFKKAKSKYVLFLNPDTKIFKNTLSNSIEFMEQNQQITVLGCQQINEKREVIKTCATELTLKKYIIKSLYLDKLLPKLFKSYKMSYWDHENSCYVDHVMGSFYMIKSVDFTHIKGFDEDYFMYYEDLDLSKRIIENEGKIYYNTEIKIYHETGGSSKNFKPQRLFYSLDSIILFGKKHFSRYKYILLSFFILIVEPLLRICFALIKFNFKETKQILLAYRMLYLKRVVK
jgi:GT2 family glycosyltransferase